ncbi:ribosomal RNA small subunit methyltransferase G [Pseudorhodoferax aquiterrae]|uniref:Ribosomal RNA small subunit methyltransferase G n=1 Tax=Pseudorhodoferax aquiterrae TaxID=747304 RepID=A0ABQ3G258_9BURK|nr:16S rRNA (guanine(527)-N(7))-methyltransferase RsmG [Pseudorhodoferax aquiterrae]GHC82263.1 ribosomal RNA small subunit methyltransferase G [Pseudorhodoferax aquiterrae]
MKGRLIDAAQALGLALSDAELEALLAYQGLIAKWNKVYNLTAVRHPEQMLTQHLVDCLAAVPPLRRVLKEQGADAPALLDVGAGAGLPGVVFAILHPQLQVHCVDTVAKKAAFVQQVAVELKLPNLRGLHARVESLGQGYDIVSSRAFASLVDFTTWSRAALKPGAVWLAMKGKEPLEEIAALPPQVQVFHVEHLQVPGLGAERCIVWMRPAAA